ncbi:MAG: TonB-dependent receptor, partial [Rhizorhabdus sp.]|nr:TonB-dependent receptor [Rhizorhabdus sp.]
MTGYSKRGTGGSSFAHAWKLTLPALLLSNVALSGVGQAEQARPAAGPDATLPGEADAIDDIVVTATRRETKLQSTPVAVSVIGETFRTNQNVITTRDLAGQ